MIQRLRTEEGEGLYEAFRDPLRRHLLDIDEQLGTTESTELNALRLTLEARRSDWSEASDEVHDDLFVLDRYVAFFERYGELWRLIAEEKFSRSWVKLQDTLDTLRGVRRFSEIETAALEEQLLELEQMYPYNVFFSIGAVVECFECSICGQDIDGDLCNHRRGHLYRGSVAVGIMKSAVADHIAIVDEPRDRRCVVQYEDSSDHFKLLRLLARLLQTGRYKVSHFGLLRYSKREVPNPDYRKLGRNEPCFCSSSKKFKHCCIDKMTVQGNHVDITPRLMTPCVAVQ